MMKEPTRNLVSMHTTTAIPAGLAITAIICVALDLRPGIVSVGPVLPSIQESFHLSHGTAALLTSIPDVFMGLLALPTPWLARRFGRDNVMIWALLLLLVATALRAFVQNMPSLLLTTAGVGAGIAISGTLIGGFIKAEFPTRLALIMGVYATSLGVGSVAAAALTVPLAGDLPDGWRFATGIWSLLGIGAIICAWMVKARESQRITPKSSTVVPLALPLRSRTAWAIAVFFGVNNLIFYAFLAWTVTIYRELGFSDQKAGVVLGVFAVASVFGNPVFGTLSRTRDRRMWLALASALCCIGLIGLVAAPLAAPYLWVALIAFGQGGGFTLGMTLPLDNTDSVRETDVWNAFTLTFGYLIAASGPLLVGILRDVTGSFQIPTICLVGVGVLMLLLTAILRPLTIAYPSA